MDVTRTTSIPSYRTGRGGPVPLGVAAGLVAAVVGFGCSESGTADPTAPLTVLASQGVCERNPDHKNCQPSEDPPGEEDGQDYRIVFTGDLTGDGSTDQQTTGVVARGYPLDLGFLAGSGMPGFDTCFGDGNYTGTLAVGDDPSTAAYFFEAKNVDGRGVKYNFKLSGGALAAGADWPPASGDASTVTYGAWSVQHDSKGSKKASCSGDGAISTEMEVTGL